MNKLFALLPLSVAAVVVEIGAGVIEDVAEDVVEIGSGLIEDVRIVSHGGSPGTPGTAYNHTVIRFALDRWTEGRPTPLRRMYWFSTIEPRLSKGASVSIEVAHAPIEPGADHRCPHVDDRVEEPHCGLVILRKIEPYDPTEPGP